MLTNTSMMQSQKNHDHKRIVSNNKQGINKQQETVRRKQFENKEGQKSFRYKVFEEGSTTHGRTDVAELNQQK